MNSIPSTDQSSPGPLDDPAPNPPPAGRGVGFYDTKLGLIGPLCLIGALSWAIPAAATGTLLQALFARLDEVNKISLTAITATVSSLGGALAVVVAGLLSDRTRSRFGRRKPWLLGGAVFAAVCLALAGLTDSFPVIVICCTGSQIGLNAMVAALSALLPDRVGRSLLGRASALSGLGNLLGNATGGIVAAGFLTAPPLGLALVPWTMVLAALIICWRLPSHSSLDQPAETGSLGQLLKSLLPPGDRDFWLVFVGRVCFLLGLLTALAYQLYILTDYFGASDEQAAGLIAASGVILAIGAGAFTVLAGPLSDRLGRRKPFVIVAGLVGAGAVGLLLTVRDIAIFPVAIACLSIAYGTFISVDQAIMVEVLPSQRHAARDLGFLTVANTAPGILAPGLAGALVGLGGYPAVFVGGIVLTGLSGVFLLSVKRVR
ncbi:MAG: MFS transporter [Propionibacteriaceae bacterium]|jgi:MFS family permease|nr:MFS transporter [Propionibacteriaceae bacterium]